MEFLKYNSSKEKKVLFAIFIPWAIFLLLINLIVTQDGGQNATSRFLSLRAMSEEATFTIDKRIGASVDWAKTPDGHYYSNKAPGPMLYGFPVFFVLDHASKFFLGTNLDENGHRPYPGYFLKTTSSLLIQLVPFLVLSFFISLWMLKNNFTISAVNFFLSTAFIGNTVSFYFNNFSGHAIAAFFVLGICFSYLKRNFFWFSFCAGSALLCDYGFGMQIPAFLFLSLIFFRNVKGVKKNFLHFLLGGVIPGVLWIWYHVLAFGSPFSIANHHQNPVFLDKANEQIQIWGLFSLPSKEVFIELLFGPSRGILYTQAWLLVLIPFFFFLPKKSDGKNLGWFCFLSFLGLLIMNASFGGWHGGMGVGPRYMSAIFPSFSLLGAFVIINFPRIISYFIWLTAIPSFIFRGLAYSSTILVAVTPLWDFYLWELRKPSMTGELRIFLFFFLLLVSIFTQYKLLRSTYSQDGVVNKHEGSV
ncbi:MAG: hypothetical protein M9962_02005 [Oligoflexia bacterium]|nr:hypothetical protein [Oligoflexia bacterium]